MGISPVRSRRITYPQKNGGDRFYGKGDVLSEKVFLRMSGTFWVDIFSNNQKRLVVFVLQVTVGVSCYKHGQQLRILPLLKDINGFALIVQ